MVALYWFKHKIVRDNKMRQNITTKNARKKYEEFFWKFGQTEKYRTTFNRGWVGVFWETESRENDDTIGTPWG